VSGGVFAAEIEELRQALGQIGRAFDEGLGLSRMAGWLNARIERADVLASDWRFRRSRSRP
jgi:hypothetical protein